LSKLQFKYFLFSYFYEHNKYITAVIMASIA